MSESQYASPFTDTASVEAWDAWFRWRDHGVLRDTAIEDTWSRVANALATTDPPAQRGRQREALFNALAGWRLLPDERVLATAGTAAEEWYEAPLHAAINAAVFVANAGDADATIRYAELSDCARVAVRTLDNAALTACVARPHVHIGIVGLADALALLGASYDSNAGRAYAAAIGRAVAEGCLVANIALARERGARYAGPHMRLASALRQEVYWPQLHDVARHGVRFDGTTALSPHPRLALLANDVADAADPLRGENHIHAIAAPGGARTIHSSGHALNLLHTRDSTQRQPETFASLPLSAQLRMRAALQPWFDWPIDYPVLTPHDPDSAQQRDLERTTSQYGLPPAAWRVLVDEHASRARRC